MKLALIGYGKMGKMIEQIARERGHEIVSIIDIDNQEEFESEAFKSADVAIEFTSGLRELPKSMESRCEGRVGQYGMAEGTWRGRATCLHSRRQNPFLGIEFQRGRCHLLGSQQVFGKNHESV